MKRSFSLRSRAVIVASTALIAGTYGLVRLAYGLMLPDVQRSLHLGAGAAGAISAGASLSYCVAAVVGMLLVARRPRLLVVGAASTAGLGALGMAVAPAVLPFTIACVIASAGAGAASPTLVAVVARNVPEERVARAQAVVNSGTGTGLVLAGVAALVLLPDWRVAWAAGGVVTLLAGAAVLVFDAASGGVGSRRSRTLATGDDRRGVQPEEPPRRSADQQRPRSVPSVGWWRRHLRVIAAAFLLGAASAAVWNSGRAVLTDAGTDQRLSVLAWVAIGLGGVAVIATTRILERLTPQAAWCVTTLALAVATAGLVLGATVLTVVLSVCVVFGWGYTAATGALIAWTTAIDRALAAPGTAMLFVVLVAGQAAGAAVAGSLIAVAGYVPVFLGAAGVAIAAAAVAVPGSARRVPVVAP